MPADTYSHTACTVKLIIMGAIIHMPSVGRTLSEPLKDSKN
jgi:hypothetical protein